MGYNRAILSSLEAKAADLDRHAAAAVSSFFRAIYQAQAEVLREFATELKVGVRCDPRLDVRTIGRQTEGERRTGG